MNNDPIGWTEYFHQIARLTAKRSKDPDTQVGCVIVNPQKKIVATGYNGHVTCKNNDEIFPWDREAPTHDGTKYPYVCHAEANALINATTSVQNCRMFVTKYPCCNCAKLICQSGIKVVYYEGEIDEDPNSKYCQVASRKMFHHCKIRTVPLSIL